jgi:hypothetical protein
MTRSQKFQSHKNQYQKLNGRVAWQSRDKKWKSCTTKKSEETKKRTETNRATSGGIKRDREHRENKKRKIGT